MMMVAMMMMVYMHLQGRDSGSALQEARLIHEDGTDDYDDGDDDGGNDDNGVANAPARQR